MPEAAGRARHAPGRRERSGDGAGVARDNQRKHGVSFKHAAGVFQDPLALTIYDDVNSSPEEEPWITLGTAGSRLLVDVHTLRDAAAEESIIRMMFRACGNDGGAAAARGQSMKYECDFSKGQRGKFHRPGARIKLPVSLYLDDEVLGRLRGRAEAEGVTLSELVNEMLRRNVGLAASDG